MPLATEFYISDYNDLEKAACLINCSSTGVTHEKNHKNFQNLLLKDRLLRLDSFVLDIAKAFKIKPNPAMINW